MIRSVVLRLHDDSSLHPADTELCYNQYQYQHAKRAGYERTGPMDTIPVSKCVWLVHGPNRSKVKWGLPVKLVHGFRRSRKV